MRELKATDKITQKMTRDGAVSENLATGEVEHISSREPETELSASSEESAGTAADLALRAAEHHEKKTARKAEKADTQAVRDGSAARQRPSSRLQFTEEERADPALRKYIDRSGRAADRLDAAKAAIPTKKVLRTVRVFDETAGKGKTQLHFDEVEKRPNGRLRHNPLSRPVHEIVHAAHAKVHEVEQENVGVEAGHKGEVLTERGLAYGKGKVRAAVHHHRTKPWRDAAKAEQASFKTNADYLYQKALHDDPALAASNPVSRFLQKQRIKRNYAKELRQAEKTAKNTAATAKSAAQKGDATALDSLIENNKSFIGKVANDLFRSMNLAQSGLNLDTDDLKQAGNLGLWKAVPKFDAARGMKFLTYAAPAIRNAMMDMVRDAFAAFEQRMVTEDKDGVCYQRVSLDDVLPGEEQLRRIEAIADPYAMQPQSIMEEQESRRELYYGLKRLTQREQTYLLYRYGFTDGEEHPLIGTAIYFHLTKGRAKKTEEQAMDNLWLELPWWFD